MLSLFGILVHFSLVQLKTGKDLGDETSVLAPSKLGETAKAFSEQTIKLRNERIVYLKTLFINISFL